MMKQALTATAAVLLLTTLTLPVYGSPHHGVGSYYYAPAGGYVVKKKKVKKYYAHNKVRKHHKRKPYRGVQIASVGDQIVATVSAPVRFIRGSLICADNVNDYLRSRGIQGTGSRLAKSFTRWGRSSGPVPGAVAVFNRGRNPSKGHVAVVSRIVNGVVYYWNPTPRGWVEGPIRRGAIAYRVASI